MERWPFSGVVGTHHARVREVSAALCLLCYAMKLSVLSLLARSFLFGGVPQA